MEQTTGHEAPNGLATHAALTVAIVAGILAISTFLANEAVKEAITGETKAAETSARLEANDTKVTLADAHSVLLRVIGGDTPEAAAALKKSLALEAHIKEVLEPVDEKLAEEIREDYAESAHANDDHFFYELSAVALQIAIVLAGVSIIARRRWLLRAGIGVAGAGTLVLLYGFAN